MYWIEKAAEIFPQKNVNFFLYFAFLWIGQIMSFIKSHRVWVRRGRVSNKIQTQMRKMRQWMIKKMNTEQKWNGTEQNEMEWHAMAWNYKTNDNEQFVPLTTFHLFKLSFPLFSIIFEVVPLHMVSFTFYH